MARKISEHTYHLCPHSTDYKERYYDNGFLGNSTNPNLPLAGVSDHTDTDGCMITAHRGSVWGFMCMDDNCWHYINLGFRYFEC
jgi:hypothetical protein